MSLNNRTMEKYVNIKSPFTGGRVKEISTIEEMEYNGMTYSVHVRYYQCEDTGEKFTTTEQDQEWYDELHSMAESQKKQYEYEDEYSMIVAEDITRTDSMSQDGHGGC